MFRKKTCVITFLDENEAPRITDPTYISDCTTMITYSDLEIEICQLTGSSCSCVPRVVLEYKVSSKLDRRVALN